VLQPDQAGWKTSSYNPAAPQGSLPTCPTRLHLLKCPSSGMHQGLLLDPEGHTMSCIAGAPASLSLSLEKFMVSLVFLAIPERVAFFRQVQISGSRRKRCDQIHVFSASRGVRIQLSPAKFFSLVFPLKKNDSRHPFSLVNTHNLGLDFSKLQAFVSFVVISKHSRPRIKVCIRFTHQRLLISCLTNTAFHSSCSPCFSSISSTFRSHCHVRQKSLPPLFPL